jgi:uncharacterized RDD family membrane protein YckC
MSENSFSLPSRDLAHPGKRFQAQFIDGLISLMLFIGLLFLSKVTNMEGAFANILIVGIPIIYFVFSDALPKGQSIGKKLLKISVVSKSTGKHCSYPQAFLRNAFTPVLGIVDAVLIFGENRQRLGDKIANTVVIKSS